MSVFLAEPPAFVILTVDLLLILLSLSILFRLSRESNAYGFACSMFQKLAQAVRCAHRDDAEEDDPLRRRVLEELQMLQQQKDEGCLCNLFICAHSRFDDFCSVVLSGLQGLGGADLRALV
eukprot:TRINITY_DN8604_c0_g1_i1.p1 TRINITY_DN8604_c0_g1~~TRINITY_DN8604_c0_g1_i1.p1  ORF type:complete len:129 (+),score=20.15 TRINITY_DN8604_c0_g1_i1:27-389(+)